MKNSRKYKLLGLVSLCLAALLCLSSCATSATGTANANAKDASGELGENITWEYTAKTKTLALTGKGDMAAIASSADVPWADARQSAEKITVENGILSISDYAFYGFDAVTSIELPDSVGKIGKLSFAFCTSLASVKLPANLKTVGDSAFEWCASLKSVDVGGSLQSLGARAFAYCSALESAYLCSAGLHIENEAFKDCKALIALVCSESVTAADGAFVGAATDLSGASFSETAPETVTIVVNYYTEGATLSFDSKIETYLVGTEYKIESPVSEGYEPDKAEISGVAEKSEIFSVIYKEIIVESETESESETEEAPVEDEKSPLANIFAIVVLVIVLGGIGVGAYFLMRSSKAEENKQKNQNKAKNRKQK